jgi:hypothetical protein
MECRFSYPGEGTFALPFGGRTAPGVDRTRGAAPYLISRMSFSLVFAAASILAM